MKKVTPRLYPRIHFECNYCPNVYPDFNGLVEHFRREHQNKEYVVIEVDAEMTEHKGK